MTNYLRNPVWIAPLIVVSRSLFSPSPSGVFGAIFLNSSVSMMVGNKLAAQWAETIEPQCPSNTAKNDQSVYTSKKKVSHLTEM